MFALSISGIDLKTFALTTGFNENNKNLIITLDANKTDKIIFLESENSFSLDEYNTYVEKSKEEISELFNRFKNVLLKKIMNN